MDDKEVTPTYHGIMGYFCGFPIEAVGVEEEDDMKQRRKCGICNGEIKEGYCKCL